MSLFYLGTHHPTWLEQTDVPLFIAHQQFEGRRTLPRARGPWALDSGGFTQLSTYGEWTIETRPYVGAVRRYLREVGQLQWASIQDWMCEPEIVAKTGMSVREHQTRTVDNLVELRMLAPELPWLPVIQGWTLGDYLDCVELYAQRGVDLTREPVVGIGSICRRQHTMRAEQIIRHLADDGLRLHAFGFKLTGLPGVTNDIVSSDSLAWSLSARKNAPLEGHDRPGPGRPRGHAKCANCLEYALDWRSKVLGITEQSH